MLLKGQVFCHGQRYFGRDQTLHHRVICQVQEHGNVVCNPALFKGTAEEISHIMLDAHSGKYNGELFVRILSQRSLLDDLSRQLVVGQTVSGKDRKLLSADQGGQSVNGGDTCMDIVSRIFSA